MKNFRKLFTLKLGATIGLAQMTSAQTSNAATDPRINPQVHVLLGELNKDASPFRALPERLSPHDPDCKSGPVRPVTRFGLSPMCYTRLSCSRLLRTLLSVS